MESEVSVPLNHQVSWDNRRQFAAIIDQFIQEHDVSPVSRDGYRRRLRNFFGWVSNGAAQEFDRVLILRYKRHLQERGMTPATQNAYLVAVRSLFSWTEANKLFPNIARGIRGAKKPRGFLRDPLTIPQVKDLITSIDCSSLRGKRDLALINLMVRTGERTIEITRANVEDIRQQSGETVLWLQGKGHDTKDEFVVLTETTLRPIMEYLVARGSPKGNEPLFGSTSDGNMHQRLSTRSIRKIIKTRLRAIHLDTPRLTAHSLRHTTVTLALLGGASVQETQRLARHSSLDSTMIYAHNINRAEGVPERKIDDLLDDTRPESA